MLLYYKLFMFCDRTSKLSKLVKSPDKTVAMKNWFQQPSMAIVAALCFCLVIITAKAMTFGEAELVYEWKSLDFDWPSASDRDEAVNNGSFIPERNILAGIKVYKSDVYVTIPRWRWTSGHPVTLAKIVEIQGQPILQPYPDWASQRVGDCQALQYVQSMEIDPNTGFMYVIDTGRVGIAGNMTLNLCPAKIVVYDLNKNTRVDSYEFQADFVSRDKNFLNDIVLDYVDGKVRFAYISDIHEGLMHVYDFQKRVGYNLVDQSMKVDAGGNGSVIHINGENYNFPIHIDGMAMSPDFNYVYYSLIGGYNLYQIPTSTLRSGNPDNKTGLRLVGRKVSQSDGLGYGSKHLFYGAIGLSAVYFWDSEADMSNQKLSIDKVRLETQRELVRNDSTMLWPDTLAFDTEGWLWFVSNGIHLWFTDSSFPSYNQDVNMRIWKVYVNETSYLYQADHRTGNNSSSNNNNNNNNNNNRNSSSRNSSSSILVIMNVIMLFVSLSGMIIAIV